MVFHSRSEGRVCGAGWAVVIAKRLYKKDVLYATKPSGLSAPVCFATLLYRPRVVAVREWRAPDSTVRTGHCMCRSPQRAAAAVCCCCRRYHREVLRKLPCTPLTRPCAANPPPTEDGCEYDGRPNGLGPLA